MKAVVFTLGCKVNEVESASIAGRLEELGLEVSDSLSPADIYVLNTCAVTREAEKKSRQLIARARKFNPAARIYVCGCASQKDADAFKARGVNGVFGAMDKQEAVNAVARDLGAAYSCTDVGAPKHLKTRAFIKIEDGCNSFCSYCVIPYLRGRAVSRPIAEIVAEAEAAPCPEVVLTGINISAYENLTGLINALGGLKKRIRLGSLECNIITDGFLEALSRLTDFAPHFHLSLQSGSDAVLRAMNRHYTRAQYLEKCALIYRYFPSAAITTDIIVGFCGETEADFNQSLSIIKEAGFARVHAFAFSPREGTKAFGLPDLPAEIKSQRLHALLAEAERAADGFISRSLGTVQSVVFEDFDGEFTGGYTPSYIKVYARGRIVGKRDCILKERYSDGALAETIEE